MPISFKQADLFGGAIVVNVPADFADVSTIRQVPDHQEVYLAVNGFASLIFDLGERVTETATDEEAVLYHFNDIVDEKDEREIVSVRREEGVVPNLPTDTPIITLTATTRPPAPTSLPTHQHTIRPNTPTQVSIHLTLIRLLDQNTDMVITLNVPHVPEDSSSAAVAQNGTTDHSNNNNISNGDSNGDSNSRNLNEEDARQIMHEVCRTLDIRDWDLFGGAE